MALVTPSGALRDFRPDYGRNLVAALLSCCLLASLVILGLILLSHMLHREEAVSLGFRVTNFEECLDELCPPLLFVVLVLLSARILLQTTRNITLSKD